MALVGFRAMFSRYQRESPSAAGAHQLLAACYDLDVSADLGRITAPTAVIHRKGDRAAPLAERRRPADGIDGATPPTVTCTVPDEVLPTTTQHL